MSTRIHRTSGLVVVIVGAVALTGCASYVKRSEFNAAISQLQQKDQSLQQQINSLSQDMKSQFAQYGTQITSLQGRISINSISYFAFNKATLSSEDKAKLDLFAKIMKAHNSGALVTVEGFADPAGGVAYNKRLGLKRANAVRDYLVNQDGMNGTQVRAVSYGEARDRQVKPGATHAAGTENRRATLVIDFAGNGTVNG